MSPRKNPWYSDGLRFECTACGGCCGGFPGFVWLSPEEIATFAGHLRLPHEDFLADHCRRLGTRWTLRETENWNCVMLKDGKCRVYGIRPVQCRTFPFWDENLDSPRDWTNAAKSCPGMGRGRLFEFAEIERLRCERHED